MTRHHLIPGAGFTLIEVMIAVALVGVLIAVGLPSYQSYVLKTYRNNAKACVVEHAQAMERFFTTNMTYVGGAAAANLLACRSEGQLDTRFTITIENVTATTFTVTATATGSQLRDARCTQFSLTEDGTRSYAGTGSAADCW